MRARASNCLASFGWTVKPSGRGRRAPGRSRRARSRRRRSRRGAARPVAGGCGLARVPLGGACGAGLLERRLQPVLEVVERGLGLFERDVAPLDQRLRVELADRAAGVDALVHERLGVARVVALVVAVAAVAHHVDHDVLVELLAVGERQPGHPHAGLGIVAVHVEDRRLHHLGHVGGVLRRAGRVGWRGEAELVVDDQVDGAADAVALDHREVERLGHHALAGERGVAVDQDRQHRVAPGRIDEVHLGPGHARRRSGRRSRGATGWRPARPRWCCRPG